MKRLPTVTSGLQFEHFASRSNPSNGDQSPPLQSHPVDKKPLARIAAMMLAGLLLAVGVRASAAAEPTASFLNNGVTAHRGDSAYFPENTMPAFISGIEVGADWIELDIFRTKDGKLVVTHDRTTGRVGDRDLDVTQSTYAELATVDVAHDFRMRKCKSIDACPSETMPLLADVLQLVMQQHRTRVSIQPKMDCVADAIQLIRDMKAEPWVGFNDGNLQYMQTVKKLAPEIPVFWDRGNTDLAEDIRIARQSGFQSLVLNVNAITADKVSTIKAAGLEAGVWTVNDKPALQRLLQMGVDRIYTDEPALLLSLIEAQAAKPPASTPQQLPFGKTACDGTYRQHLQGICTDRKETLYWSFTSTLVKTDRNGKIIKKIPVRDHHGDLCYHDGRLYVAVNFGPFNDPEGKADSWVFVYDADSLQELAKHRTPQVIYGAGGMARVDDHFLVVGGLPPDKVENYVYEYDRDFRFVRKHTIPSGYTRLGIQAADFADGIWWFGCYGKELLKTDAQFNVLGKYDFDCGYGIVNIAPDTFLTARGRCAKNVGCTGEVVIADVDDEKGLVIRKTDDKQDDKQE